FKENIITKFFLNLPYFFLNILEKRGFKHKRKCRLWGRNNIHKINKEYYLNGFEISRNRSIYFNK
ncbi:MAG: hypothetical protein ACXWEW_03530, partial [Nitrososphaeraceae archaeon]